MKKQVAEVPTTAQNAPQAMVPEVQTQATEVPVAAKKASLEPEVNM